MLRRKVYRTLMEWKNRGSKKCLLVKGQRQVGKTFIIRRFAQDNYETVIYADLSSDTDFRNTFRESSVDGIVNRIKLIRGLEAIDPSDTLFIFDEIQSSDRARSALKMFTMDGRYSVIASGSLLGVTNPEKRKKIPAPSEAVAPIVDEESFAQALERDEEENESVSVLPMGYEEHVTMYSLDFEEFLWARGVPKDSIDAVRSSIHTRTPMDDSLLKTMDRHFRDYMIVGGMPEAVMAFVEGNGDYMMSGKALRDTISTCLSDFKEYTYPIKEEKVRDCFFSIPVMLSKSNKKFMFSKIENNNGDEKRRDAAAKATNRTYDDSLMWLKQAGYTNFCFNLRDITHPIEASVDRKSFKVYMSDTGMLNSLLGTESIRATYLWETGYNMGAITENAVAEGIRKSGLRVRYYGCTDNSDGMRMEIDFILEFGRDIIAIEVKSGRDRSAPSLGKVRKVFNQVNRRAVLSRTNVYTDKDGIEHYPLFAACFANELAKDWDGPSFIGFDE